MHTTLRKLGVGMCTGLAALGTIGLVPQSALAHDPGCGGKSLAKGIYNKGWEVGKFDLANAYPGTGKAGQVDGFVGTVNICGTSDETNVFAKEGTVTTPGQGEVIRCANPKATGKAKAYCAKQRNSGAKDLPTGMWIGWGQSDQYSKGLGLQFDDTPIDTTVQPQGGSRFGKDAGDAVQKHCNKVGSKNTAGITIACYRSELDLVLAKCGSDIVWTLDATGKLPRMTVYSPTCYPVGNPLYIDGIDELAICGYALPKTPDENRCGTPAANGKLWTGKNGKAGCWGGDGATKGYELTVTWTSKSVDIANTTKPVCWAS